MIPKIPGSGNHLEDDKDKELEEEHEEDCECQDCCENRINQAEYQEDQSEDR